jgi:hypothetical protein
VQLLADKSSHESIIPETVRTTADGNDRPETCEMKKKNKTAKQWEKIPLFTILSHKKMYAKSQHQTNIYLFYTSFFCAIRRTQP